MAGRLTAAERVHRMEVIQRFRASGKWSWVQIGLALGVDREVVRRWYENAVNPKPARNHARQRPAAQVRNCFRCKDPFRSAHAGVRHCSGCRNWLATAHNPYEPDPGGSAGRQVTARLA